MLPPGPRNHALWHTFDFMMRPAQMLARHRTRYGDIFRVNTLMLDAVFVCSPALAKEVFAHDPDDFGSFTKVLGDTLGTHALAASFGARHRGQRKFLNPPFHGPQVRAFLDATKVITLRHLAAFESAMRSRTIVRMLDVGQAISLDVIVETVFGAHGDDRERARLVLEDILEGFSPLVLFAPGLRTSLFPPWRRFLKRRRAFDALVRDVLSERRRSSHRSADVVTMLLDVRDQGGEPLSDEEIRDHLLTLLLAGHETSAIAIAWGVYWLLREPHALSRLRSELDAFGVDPSVEALSRAPYLGAVCNETLRIRPIFTDSIRLLDRPVQIGDWTVPKGSALVVALQSILTDPATYPDPERFLPERFLEKKYGPAEFVPFGGGQRRCLGAVIAEQQLRIVLGTIAANWELELADKGPERSARRHVTMAPARGVRLRVAGRRRHGSH
jgi:cytochrome P450